MIVAAARSGAVLESIAGGSKRAVANPSRTTVPVDLGAFAGIVDYDPSELVLTVRPATPLAEIERLLADHGQMLAFEPWDWGILFGQGAAVSTIGGVVASGVAGSRRLSAGGARDHLLGFQAVSGQGEQFKAGGKVVKNVTGFDLAKLIAGSWGQLAILTELSLKVLPAPRWSVTVQAEGLDTITAVGAMAAGVASPAAPVAAGHLPGRGSHRSRTCLRLEGFKASVEHRASQLATQLAGYGPVEVLPEAAARSTWLDLREARPLLDRPTLWRAHLAPSRTGALTSALDAAGADWLLDWAGGLVWIGAPAVTDVRAIVTAHEGHAMLLRAPTELRQRLPVRQPESSPVAALTRRLKLAFDPSGVLDPHRFG